MSFNKNVSTIELLALLLSDIEIFLLMEDDQETLKDKLYTAKEIQDQFSISMDKIANVLYEHGYDLTKPIKP
jgi:hypothetical protein